MATLGHHTYLNKKRCLQIKNKDELCCVRAIVVAKAKLDKDPQYKSIVAHGKPFHTHLAQGFHEIAGVPVGPCGIEEINKFQAVPGNQLNVVSLLSFISVPRPTNVYTYTTTIITM